MQKRKRTDPYKASAPVRGQTLPTLAGSAVSAASPPKGTVVHPLFLLIFFLSIIETVLQMTQFRGIGSASTLRCL
jgi:hypothetical protein